MYEARSGEPGHTSEKNLRIILQEGPFSEEVVMSWPSEMRKDYLELLADDLETHGLEEFRRIRCALGEAYLLSLGRPIEANAVLLDSWNWLTGGELPPKLPDFSVY
jgi:hypothetical protein